MVNDMGVYALNRASTETYRKLYYNPLIYGVYKHYIFIGMCIQSFYFIFRHCRTIIIIISRRIMNMFLYKWTTL